MNAINSQTFLTLPNEGSLINGSPKSKEAVVEKMIAIFSETITNNPHHQTYEFSFQLRLRQEICSMVKSAFEKQSDYRFEVEVLDQQYLIGTAVRFKNALAEQEDVLKQAVSHDAICHSMCRIHPDCPSMERAYNSKFYD